MGRARRSTPSSAPPGECSSPSLCRHPAAATHDLPCHYHHVAAGCPATSTSSGPYSDVSVPVLQLMLLVPSMALLTSFTVPFQPRLPGLCCLCVPHGRHPGGLQRALRPPREPPPPVGCLRGQGALPTARRGERLPRALGPFCSSDCSLGVVWS